MMDSVVRMDRKAQRKSTNRINSSLVRDFLVPAPASKVLAVEICGKIPSYSLTLSRSSRLMPTLCPEAKSEPVARFSNLSSAS